MSSALKDDLLYLLNILESVEKITLYAKDANDAESFYLLNDQLNFNAVLTLLANIGETVGSLSQSLRENHPEIPWQTIKNFRNRVVHNYHGLDIFIIFDLIQDSLPLLREQLVSLVAQGVIHRDIDPEEFEVARDSYYYRHIPFDEIDAILRGENDS